MSRSGYTDDDDDPLATGRWRAQVNSAIRGKRGQAFLRELIAALDAMLEKSLIAEELVTAEGQVCAIGAVCKARGIDVSHVDYDSPDDVASKVGVASQMVAEIEYENDECGYRFEKVQLPESPERPKFAPDFTWERIEETPEERWQRMRRWAEARLSKST